MPRGRGVIGEKKHRGFRRRGKAEVRKGNQPWKKTVNAPGDS